MSERLTFRSKCPHCGIKGVAMEVANHQHVKAAKVDAFARCGHCKRFVLATFSRIPYNDFGYLLRLADDFIQSHLTISPSLERQGAPPDTDEDAAEYYRQGEDNLPNNPDAAVTMFRKALETAIQKSLTDAGHKPNLNLHRAIKKAHKEGIIHGSMKDWADNIRIFGNEAVHGERMSKEDADEIKEFTKVFFQYLYTLPEAVKRQRQRTDRQQQESENDAEPEA